MAEAAPNRYHSISYGGRVMARGRSGSSETSESSASKGVPQVSKTPLDQLEPRRIGIVKPSALGDVVQTLPVLTAMRARWPQARIVWVVNRPFAGILDGHPDLDAVMFFDRRTSSWWERAKSLTGFVQVLRAEKFDLVFDLQGLLRSGLMAWFSGARRRVGFADAREGSKWLYTDVVPAMPWETPALERYWQMVRAWGGGDAVPAAKFGFRPLHHAWAEAAWRHLPEPWIAVHPGAQWQTKRWPAAKYAEVLKRIQERFDAGVALVGSGAERPICDEIAAALPGGVVNLAGETSLLQLAALLRRAKVMLSNDSGPMHLAAALGTRCVSLFTCTSPRRAGPHGPDHRVLATNVPCAASYFKTCPTMHCMEDLTVSRVAEALSDSLPIIH